MEGYLFSDLDKMSLIKLQGQERYGASGYPIVASVCAGMELLGSLVYPHSKKFNELSGNEYFRFFWNEYMTKKPEYIPQLGILFRKLVRHGLAHSFLAKPGVCVLKDDPSQHLRVGSHELFVDANAFIRDFKEVYTNFWKPSLTVSNVGDHVQLRLESMLRIYESSSIKEFNTFHNGLPDDSPYKRKRISSIHNASPAATFGSPAATMTSIPSTASGIHFASAVSLSASPAFSSSSVLELLKRKNK